MGVRQNKQTVCHYHYAPINVCPAKRHAKADIKYYDQIGPQAKIQSDYAIVGHSFANVIGVVVIQTLAS